MRTIYAGIAILVLLLLMGYTPKVGASPSSAQYSIIVTNGAVSVSINLNMIQNVTTLPYERSFTLPPIHSLEAGANSTALAQLIQHSLQLKSPKAQVNNLSFQVASSNWSNKTNTQWLNASLAFDVSGVIASQGGTVQVDLSWKSFNISLAYSLAGMEVNRIGENYLMGVAADLAAHNSGSQFVQIFYEVNGRGVDPTRFRDSVKNMTILDFSSFAPPLSKWQESHVALANESWSFSGGKGLGMAFIQQSNEGGELVRAKYGLFYDLNGIISAPRSARANGDTITLVPGGLPEVVMGGVILSTLVLLSGTFLLERRVQNKTVKKKTKR